MIKAIQPNPDRGFTVRLFPLSSLSSAFCRQLLLDVVWAFVDNPHHSKKPCDDLDEAGTACGIDWALID